MQIEGKPSSDDLLKRRLSPTAACGSNELTTRYSRIAEGSLAWMKRRICSYCMLEVPSGSYVVADAEGEVYLCNARCLCLWAIALATKPNLREALKMQKLTLTCAQGLPETFDSMAAVARWASANALGTEA